MQTYLSLLLSCVAGFILLDINSNGGRRERNACILANGSVTRARDEISSNEVETRQPRQRLDKYISFMPAIAFNANLQATWESVAVSFQAGLLNGGPTSPVWGSLIAWIGSMAMAASLAEMASLNPTMGAQYRWTSMFAPPRVPSPAFSGLLQGWITVFTWIATCAQPAFF